MPSELAHMTASFKEQRRRDCARRHCRSYRGHTLQRQRLKALFGAGQGRPGSTDKALKWLNFLDAPGNA